LSRPSSTKLTLDTLYTSTTTYDTYGRPSTNSHQRGSEAAKTYRHVYGSLGDLIRVERGSQVLWRLLDHDASRRATVQGLGNGLVQERTYDPQSARLVASALSVANGATKLQQAYTWDNLGRLGQRTRWWDGVGSTEDYVYDALDRLNSTQVQGEALLSQTYDAIGNLKSKTGLGSYTYPAAGAARPHAVQSTALGAYGYDNNGNLTSAPNGTTIIWTAFDQPDKITRNGKWSQFGYGAEQQRARQTRSDGTAIYYAGAMEVEVTSGQATVKTYWPAGLGLEIDKPGQSTELLWTHTDHQGSLLALTTATGAWKEKLDYDAWGKRRTTDGAGTPDTLDGQTDNKGYTGHEMLDQLDLVHMNGRVYDPKIARFLSADPIIQDPEHSQSYNRYSYVWNNPTNMTDPTGLCAYKNENRCETLGWKVVYSAAVSYRCKQ
jgi:RHS repeat-associated protein